MRDAPLVIACDVPAARSLANALAGEFLAIPSASEALERWRGRELGEATRYSVAVAPWSGHSEAGAVLDTPAEAWLARAEEPIARWVFALGVAAAHCADGGAIVAVVERPAPLDCAGFAPEAAVADAACALVRSLARSEGPRGVRVNAVVTSARLAPAKPVAPLPALASFPGTLAREVAGAVRMLLTSDANGVTGQVIAADCGRTW
jgi:enoyl-[acyl-carrier-protein] reductase (NADH)